MLPLGRVLDEAQVAAGAYDQQIANLVTGLQRLGLPVYLRIGYEFNGLIWNGYQPVPYQQAFVRITNALRAANLEVHGRDGDLDISDLNGSVDVSSDTASVPVTGPSVSDRDRLGETYNPFT